MNRDVFGAEGDFVTSPEISQLFGEMVGAWAAATWASRLGAPPRVQLIELGPGRGTLMADLLRVRRLAREGGRERGGSCSLLLALLAQSDLLKPFAPVFCRPRGTLRRLPRRWRCTWWR